jgi:hypothetical protein
MGFKVHRANGQLLVERYAGQREVLEEVAYAEREVSPRSYLRGLRGDVEKDA